MVKKIILALWSIDLLLIIGCAIIAQYRPFTSLESGFVIFIFFILVLTAMLLQTIKNRNINHAISMQPLDEEFLRKINRDNFIFKIAFVLCGYLYAIHELVTRIVASYK